MGNVSHELKTPLFTVQGYILTLIDGAIKDKKVRDKYLNRASKGLDRLIYIVKDLDMITKLEAGELHLREEEFDIIVPFNANVPETSDFDVSSVGSIVRSVENLVAEQN